MDRKKNRPNRSIVRKICPIPSKNQPPSKQRCFFVVETRRALPASRNAFSPTGGPASGLFSNSASVAPSPAPVPAPSPAPPTPTCVTADIFADCFASCLGVIDAGSPGPVCGWTWRDPFGPKGGQVSFTPGVMSLDTLGGPSDTPAASKSLLIPLSGIVSLTGQYTFTEFPGSAGSGSAQYDFYLSDTGPLNGMDIFLDGAGAVFVSIGSLASLDGYVGAWTPNNGTHKVDFSVDSFGVPTLFIDDVAIPLTFLGTGFSFLATLPSNVFMPTATFATSTSSALVTKISITSGNLPPSTVYCCP